MTFIQVARQRVKNLQALAAVPPNMRASAPVSATMLATPPKEEPLNHQEEMAMRSFEANVATIKQDSSASVDIVRAEADKPAHEASFEDVFKRGQWFEFRGDRSKVRLVWVSPRRSIFLFSNPALKKVYRFDVSKVWAYYKSEHLTPIEHLGNISTSNLITEAIDVFRKRWAA